jgi:hypothetical protein
MIPFQWLNKLFWAIIGGIIIGSIGESKGSCRFMN